MIPVVISGGSGTRLWPVSRAQFPKQFCELLDESLFLKTYKRVKPLGEPWVLSLASMQTLTQKVLLDAGESQARMIFEPLGRNTLPALAYLCWTLKNEKRDDEVVGVFPADHLIEPAVEFLKVIEEAARWASEDHVVTVGIQPTFPATGYGYIETEALHVRARKALRFCEKPDLKTAEQFVASGRFFWNAGIFLFKVKTLISLIQKFQPKVWTSLEQIKFDLTNLRDVYESLPNISVDYGIMEKLESHICIPSQFSWNDIGSWDALSQVLVPQRTAIIEDAGERNFIFPQESKTYALIGVNDLVVVDTADALLISQKGRTEEVKEIHKKLEARGSKTVKDHIFEIRPWGRFEVLKETPEFKSKVISVAPGAQFSLQSHQHRSEHWIVIRGQGEVVLDDQIVSVKKGSYIHVAVGSKHRMRNTGMQPLDFVEVQLGDYFGEDDIVRYQDDFKRA